VVHGPGVDGEDGEPQVAGPPDSAATIAQLDEILEDCRARNSAIGYFPAMYRAVTAKLATDIEAARFENPQLAERLVGTFAARYFDAYRQHRSGRPSTRSWEAAFAMAEGRRRTILQHLLAGVNAHINLDLGVAAASVSERVVGPDLERFHRDFARVNAVLFALMDTVQDDLGKVSPWMGVIDWLGCRWDEGIMGCTIAVARDGAWSFSRSLSAGGDRRADLTAARDRWTAGLAAVIDSPRPLLRGATWLVLCREERDAATVIDHLAGRRVDPARLQARSAGLPSGP